MADASSRNRLISSEPRIEMKEAITSLLVKSGMSPPDADNLYCKLKAFPPKYHSMILKYADLSGEVQSMVLSFLEEQNKIERIEGDQTQETGTATSLEEQYPAGIGIKSGSPQFVVSGELQREKTLTESRLEIEGMVGKLLREKVEGLTAEESKVVTGEETATIVQEVEEKEPFIEQKALQGYVSLENDAKSKREIEEVLEEIENSFSEMSLDEQEEIMPRYIKLRIFHCKDRRETDSSCIKCLINNTIDCPLFKP